MDARGPEEEENGALSTGVGVAWTRTSSAAATAQIRPRDFIMVSIASSSNNGICIVQNSKETPHRTALLRGEPCRISIIIYTQARGPLAE